MRATMRGLRPINGVELWIEDAGAGPAVVLTHGYSATADMWAPQRRALEERYRVATWDLRGHGRSASPDDPGAYSHELAIDDLREILDALDVERAVVGGLSLGGFLSLAFYGRYPERVRALVIADSGPGYRSDEARSQWNALAQSRARDLEERGLEALAGGTRERTEAMLVHGSAQGLAHAARGLLAQRDATVIDSLGGIGVPTLVVVGSEDEPFLAPCEYMARKIPGARLEIIEGAGHAANLDRPEHFNKVLLDFLDGLPAEG